MDIAGIMTCIATIVIACTCKDILRVLRSRNREIRRIRRIVQRMYTDENR